MNKNQTSHKLLIVTALLFSSFCAQAQDTRIKITDIRNKDGQILVQVFTNSDGYEKEQPFKRFTFDKKDVANGVKNIHFSLPSGTYGITMVDDENGNGKIDKNMVSIPKEGFGFSNFFMTKVKKPAFEDFKVDECYLMYLIKQRLRTGTT